MSVRSLSVDDSVLLVAEANHRFFNSLQVISALAARCHRAEDVGELRPMLQELGNRLGAFATIHRSLCDSIDDRTLEAHCCDLARSLIGAFGRKDVAHVDMDCRSLNEAQAGRMALLVAELVTNALKHSLAGREAEVIRITLRTVGAMLELTVSDTAGTEVASPPPVPSRIVMALAASMAGEAVVIDKNGYAVRVRIPCAEPTLEIAPVLRATPASVRHATL